MGPGLPLVALMVVLAVILVPARDFLLFRLLLLLGNFVDTRGFRFLLLRIEVLAMLCHIILRIKGVRGVLQ